MLPKNQKKKKKKKALRKRRLGSERTWELEESLDKQVSPS